MKYPAPVGALVEKGQLGADTEGAAGYGQLTHGQEMLGSRPARVDRFSGDATRMLNDVHSRVQAGVSTSIGMPFLAEDC